VLDNLRIRKTRIGLQQDECPSYHTHRPCAGLYNLLQLPSCLVREAHYVFLHAGTYTTGKDFMEDVLGSEPGGAAH
jgi:hypothetical protein